MITTLVLVALVAVILVPLSGLRVAKEYERAVVFRLGRFVGVRGPGLFWIVPLAIERSSIVDMRVQNNKRRSHATA